MIGLVVKTRSGLIRARSTDGVRAFTGIQSDDHRSRADGVGGRSEGGAFDLGSQRMNHPVLIAA
jgi:hypothetical protein